ncbi:ATP-binding protein [Streptomyces sp. T1317-0309]|nr:ATP-binding protein [Streptomyces sp. T1317-0309]
MTPPTAGTLTPHAQPEPGPRHFLSLPHAQTVPTPTLDAVHRALEQTLAEQAAMCLYGDAGCGKTFAVQSVLDKTSVSRPGLLGGVRICHLSPRPAPTPTALRAELLSHVGMGITGSPTRDPGVLDATLRTHLAAHQHLLVVDEAGRLTPDASSTSATSSTTPPPNSHSCSSPTQAASACCAASRYWLPASPSCCRLPLTPDEVRWAIPQLTPLWRDVDEPALDWLDARHCHGNFRRWTQITHHALRLQRRASPPTTAMLHRLLDGCLPPHEDHR